MPPTHTHITCHIRDGVRASVWLFEYLSVSVVHLVGLDGSATGLTAVIHHHVELSPCPELPLPVGNGGERSDDQERPMDPLQVDLIQECDGLHRLPQTHLIRQDTVASEQV